MWENFWEAGGFGMYPTAIFGVLLIAASVGFAVFPERRFVPLVVSLSVVAVGSGLLGCTAGFITTFRYIQGVPEAKQHAITLMGISESLNNVALAFGFLVLATLVASGGALRLALTSRRPGAKATTQTGADRPAT